MTTEKRLIDANALDGVLEDFANSYRKDLFLLTAQAISDVRKIVYAMKDVDAVEVVHGRWEKHGKHDWRCSACKVGVPYSYTGNHYCHNCGAKMDGDKNE